MTDVEGVSLQPLLAPTSIALVGASNRENSFGQALLDMASGCGYRGALYPVNPHRTGDASGRFYGSLEDLPGPVEHVVAAVAEHRLESVLRQAITNGARAATVFADCSAEVGARLTRLAREAGLLLCGPNSMGFHNLDLSLRITPFPAPLNLVPGGITAILQSGSVLGALAHNDRRLRFNLLVSTGSEAVVSAADYLHWALEQETTLIPRRLGP